MIHSHLILADIHENWISLENFVRQAERNCPNGFDIWILGDLLGHSEQSSGQRNLTNQFLEALKLLRDFETKFIFGNWEYWLFHPEQDDSNPAQQPYQAELAQRRAFLSANESGLLAQLTAHEKLELPTGDPQFTLFHGCSFACHDRYGYRAAPCESYLNPKDLNIVTRELFGNPDHLRTPHFLFGHTHLPGYFVYSKSSMVDIWMQYHHSLTDRIISYGNVAQRFGINPGSAGVATQTIPRTGLILDTAARTFKFITDEQPN